MIYTNFGSTGLQVSRIALGTATFGVAPRDKEADALVGRALDLGINIFDCANSYGNQKRFDRPGVPAAELRESAESILGRALRGHRNDVVLCSKVMERVGTGVNDRGLSRKHIFLQIEETLRRFNTDYLDVYYAHRPDPGTSMEQTVRAFDDLIRQGKIRYWALSVHPGWRMVEGLWAADRLGLNPPVCSQCSYNLLDRDVEKDVVPVSLQHGMAMTVYGPLHGGLLSGPEVLERTIVGNARWGKSGFTKRQIELARRHYDVATAHGVKPGALALAWVLSRPAVTCAIVGPETTRELEDSVAAVELQLPSGIFETLAEIGGPG